MKSADSRVRLVQSGLYLFWFGTRTRTSSSNATFWFGSWSWLTLRVNRLLFTLIFHCKSSHPIITPHSSEHTMSTKGPGVWTADHQVGAQPQALQRDIKVQRLFSFCFTCSEWDRDPTLLEHGQKILDWEQRRQTATDTALICVSMNFRIKSGGKNVVQTSDSQTPMF